VLNEHAREHILAEAARRSAMERTPSQVEVVSKQFQSIQDSLNNELDKLFEAYDQLLLRCKPWAAPFCASAIVRKNRLLGIYLKLLSLTPLMPFWPWYPLFLRTVGSRSKPRYKGSQLPLRLAEGRIKGFLESIASILQDFGRSLGANKLEPIVHVEHKIGEYTGNLPKAKGIMSAGELSNLLLTAFGVIIAAAAFELSFAVLVRAYFSTASVIYQIAIVLGFLIIVWAILNLILAPLILTIGLRVMIYFKSVAELEVKKKEESVRRSIYPLIRETAEKMFT
jgi:hypothetical protein